MNQTIHLKTDNFENNTTYLIGKTTAWAYMQKQRLTIK